MPDGTTQCAEGTFADAPVAATLDPRTIDTGLMQGGRMADQQGKDRHHHHDDRPSGHGHPCRHVPVVPDLTDERPSSEPDGG